jgi:regulator of protease activity HflC (stomatin/prohibitin superfamily)
MSVVILVILVAIVLLVALTVFRTVRIVNQGLVGVVLRVGQFRAVRQPGMRILAPFVDRMVLVDMRETPRTGERQDVITKDNVSLAVNATIFSQVVEPRLALFAVSNYFVAIDQLARTTLRSVMGSMSLDECLSEREKINSQLQMAMESVTDKWGIRINRVEILDIVPPQQILQAMALQKQADQERRAAILQSEGQQQAAINVSEGTKQASIRQAEGEKQAAILRAEATRQALILQAEGNKQAQVLDAEGRAQAVSTVYQAITSSRPTPELLAVLQLDTLAKVASSPNSKVVVPFESVGLMGAAQALRGVISSVPDGTNGALPASGE